MVSRQEWYVLGDDGNGNSLTSSNWQAQTFTIGTVGGNYEFTINSVDIKYTSTGGTTATADVGIYYTLPDGSPDIDSGPLAYVSGFNLGTHATAWKRIALTNRAQLRRDTKYALVIFRASGDHTVTWREDASTPGYTGGAIWQSTDTGASWATSDIDKMFQINALTYVGTLCTTSEATNKAGANANTTSTSDTLVGEFIQQAESELCAITRFNWIDAYSTLTDDVKQILNSITSNAAAIKIINYDMSGYTTRTEAETMINVLRDENQRQMSLLRNQEVKRFMVDDT